MRKYNITINNQTWDIESTNKETAIKRSIGYYFTELKARNILSLNMDKNGSLSQISIRIRRVM